MAKLTKYQLKKVQNNELRDRGCEKEFKALLAKLKRGGETPFDARRKALETYLPDWVGGQPPVSAIAVEEEPPKEDPPPPPSPPPSESTPSPAVTDEPSAGDFYARPEDFEGKPESSQIEDMRWVYRNMAFRLEEVDPKSAPSPGAYRLLQWARVNPKEFYNRAMPLLHKQEENGTDAETLEADGRVQAEFIQMVMDASREAREGGNEQVAMEGGEGSGEPEVMGGYPPEALPRGHLQAEGTDTDAESGGGERDCGHNPGVDRQGDVGVRAEDGCIRQHRDKAGGPRVFTAGELQAMRERANGATEAAVGPSDEDW